jgi:hypothetical protein
VETSLTLPTWITAEQPLRGQLAPAASGRR